MRLSKREVKDFEEVVQIISHCDIVTLGLYDHEMYMVPVSFGYEIIDSTIVLYIHGAKVGRKYECLKKKDDICVSLSLLNGYVQKDYGFTAYYESVFAKARVQELKDKQAIHGLNCLMEHCDFDGKVDQCTTLPFTSVFSLTLYDINAKKRD